jgi:hypothetical protein
MSIELTPSEQAYARKLAARYEKQSRRWRRHRFVVLAAALLLFCVAAAGWAVAASIGNDVFDPAALPGDDAALSQVVFDLHFDQLLATMATIVYVQALLAGCCGAWMLVLAITRWNQHLLLGIEAKLLRAQLGLGPEQAGGPHG